MDIFIFFDTFILIACSLLVTAVIYEESKEAGHLVFTKRGLLGVIALLFILFTNIARSSGYISPDFQYVLDALGLVAGGIFIGSGLNSIDRDKESEQIKRDEHKRIDRLIDHTDVENGNEHVEKRDCHATINRATRKTE